ncbi:MAG: GYD domain-containing protein [Chloroflexota bacterium]
MPKYLFIGSYTAEGAKGVLKEGGTARRAATEKLVASLGGTVEAYYFGFGSDDFYLIADLPGNAAAAAGALTTAASGAVGTRTIVLLTPEELDAAAKLSPSYRRPGG